MQIQKPPGGGYIVSPSPSPFNNNENWFKRLLDNIGEFFSGIIDWLSDRISARTFIYGVAAVVLAILVIFKLTSYPGYTPGQIIKMLQLLPEDASYALGAAPDQYAGCEFDSEVCIGQGSTITASVECDERSLSFSFSSDGEITISGSGDGITSELTLKQPIDAPAPGITPDSVVALTGSDFIDRLHEQLDGESDCELVETDLCANREKPTVSFTVSCGLVIIKYETSGPLTISAQDENGAVSFDLLKGEH